MFIQEAAIRLGILNLHFYRPNNVQHTFPIIILNWNNADDTLECLGSLKSLSCKDFDIFLIDNHSEEADRLRLQDYCLQNESVCFIQNESNLGFGRAHNEVFRSQIFPRGYNYVVLLNNDTTVEPDWLSKISNCIAEEQPDMISCKMLNYSDHRTINNLGHKFQNTGDILPIANNEPSDHYTKRFVNAGASGGAAVYSVSMLRDIGLFDEYFFCGYEDAELGVRAMIAGYKLIVEPESIVFHKVSATVNTVRNYNFALKIQLDLMYSYFKLMPWPVILANAPFAFFRNGLLLLIFIAFGRFKYIKIFFHAWYLFLTRDLKTVAKQRKNIKKIRRLSSIQILCRQEFFLKDNIKRFKRYFILGNKTIFEQF